MPRNERRPDELMHDLFPPIRYIDPPELMKWYHRQQPRCSMTDEIERRCVRQVDHDAECVMLKEPMPIRYWKELTEKGASAE